MLRSERSRADIERRQGPVKPYSDPLLVRNRRRYRRFILDLDARGMLRYTRFPKAHVGVFFVWKKGKLASTMILDAREANRAFGDPPGVKLCSAETFSKIECQ